MAVKNVDGPVPREYSTGGKQKLLGISKQGNRYVRKLLVHRARSCFRHLDRTRDRLGSCLDGLQARMHPNKAVIALAAKIARIVWVMLTKPGALTSHLRSDRCPILPVGDQIIDGDGVGARQGITELVLGVLAQAAAYDLGGAGLRHAGRELDLIWRGDRSKVRAFVEN